MDYIRQNIRSIIVLLFLTVGILVGLILVQNKTIFKSRATADIDYPGALNITNSSGDPLQYKGEGVYLIKSDNVKIKLGIKDFSKLIQNKDLDRNEVLRHYDAYEPADWNGYVGRAEIILKSIEPLSPIPTSCQSIGPSRAMKIPTVAPWLKSASGFTEEIKKYREGSGECKTPSWMSLVWKWGCGTEWFQYKWDDSGNLPMTQGDEDPRWMIRALRIMAALENEVDPGWHWPAWRGYWFKENGKGLEAVCNRVLELKERALLRGLWLSSDDKLEETGRGAIGQ